MTEGPKGFDLPEEPYKSSIAAAYDQNRNSSHKSEDTDGESEPADASNIFEGKKKKRKSKTASDYLKACMSSRYSVFDHTGNVPFAIVFGLKHGRSEPLVLDADESFLDVPHALAIGLLLLYEVDAHNNKTPIEVPQPSDVVPHRENHVVIPPSPNEGAGRRQWTVDEYIVEPTSHLGSLFRVGKRYEIRFASTKDLDSGVKWYGYGKTDDLLRGPEQSRVPSESPKLLLSDAHGVARFKVVESIPQPPALTTHLRICPCTDPNDSISLEVSVTNTSSDAITVQTSGEQQFLRRQGPLGAGFDIHGNWAYDPRARIIDRSDAAPLYSIRILNLTSGEVVREARKSPNSAPLTKAGSPAHLDRRPRMSSLVTLKPGEPVVRTFSIDQCLKWREDNTQPITVLPDGMYGVRLEPREMWWCQGDRDEFGVDEGERLPKDLWKTKILPVQLDCEDTVEVDVRDGRVEPSQ